MKPIKFEVNDDRDEMRAFDDESGNDLIVCLTGLREFMSLPRNAKKVFVTPKKRKPRGNNWVRIEPTTRPIHMCMLVDGKPKMFLSNTHDKLTDLIVMGYRYLVVEYV
jgi:hypothetical protein